MRMKGIVEGWNENENENACESQIDDGFDLRFGSFPSVCDENHGDHYAHDSCCGFGFCFSIWIDCDERKIGDRALGFALSLSPCLCLYVKKSRTEEELAVQVDQEEEREGEAEMNRKNAMGETKLRSKEE